MKRSCNAEAALTEPVDDEKVSRVTVCPRVVRTDKPGSTARIPVRLCNMSAKILTFQPKTIKIIVRSFGSSKNTKLEASVTWKRLRSSTEIQ